MSNLDVLIQAQGRAEGGSESFAASHKETIGVLISEKAPIVHWLSSARAAPSGEVYRQLSIGGGRRPDPQPNGRHIHTESCYTREVGI